VKVAVKTCQWDGRRSAERNGVQEERYRRERGMGRIGTEPGSAGAGWACDGARRDSVACRCAYGCRDLAFAVSLAGVFRCPPLDEPAQEEVKHGFVVAVLSSYICRMMKTDASEGFLAGVFHDAGRLVVLNALADYGRKDSRLWDPEVARRVGNGAHGPLGTLLLERWGLGGTVRECARHHHKPGQTDEPLATVVAMADYVDRLGGSTESERAERLSENPCPHGPGLSAAHVTALAGAADAARNDPMLGAIAG